MTANIGSLGSPTGPTRLARRPAAAGKCCGPFRKPTTFIVRDLSGQRFRYERENPGELSTSTSRSSAVLDRWGIASPADKPAWSIATSASVGSTPDRFSGFQGIQLIQAEPPQNTTDSGWRDADLRSDLLSRPALAA